MFRFPKIIAAKVERTFVTILCPADVIGAPFDPNNEENSLG